MLPWGHAAVGYLCYTLYSRLSYRGPPVGAAVLALAVGTQFPDLIDKPMAWTFGVFPSGRSFAHSLLTLAVVAGVLYAIYRNRAELVTATAFLVGWASHLFADAYPLLFGEPTCLRYLLWPVFGVCPYEEGSRSIVGHLLAIELGNGIWFGIGLTAVAGVVWLYDGAPGARYLLRSVANRLQ
ncbi:MAG: metal-dependent hydrolase [Halolamina sp.]|uniref:metal-dependent hydrolase n=1 Tax=Halolamina sp. TaxID=1940283 RepID=UPI002FC29027